MANSGGVDAAPGRWYFITDDEDCKDYPSGRAAIDDYIQRRREATAAAAYRAIHAAIDRQQQEKGLSARRQKT